MSKKKLLKLILQELNSINSKLYRSEDSEPKIAYKQRVGETPLKNSLLEAMDFLKDGIEIKPQVGMLQALENSQGSDFTNSLLQQLTQAENKTQVLAMREEWEAKKEAKISEAKNEREATNERERARCLLYNEGALESTDKSKELTKEEIDAKIIAVQKEIDMKLQKIFEKAKKR